MDGFCCVLVSEIAPLALMGFDDVHMAEDWLQANGFVLVGVNDNVINAAPELLATPNQDSNNSYSLTLATPHPNPYVHNLRWYKRGETRALLHEYLYPHQPTRLKILLGDKPREFRFWDDYGLEWQVTIAPPIYKVWLSDGDYNDAFTPVTPTFADFDEMIDWLLSRKDMDYWEQRLA